MSGEDAAMRNIRAPSVPAAEFLRDVIFAVFPGAVNPALRFFRAVEQPLAASPHINPVELAVVKGALQLRKLIFEPAQPALRSQPTKHTSKSKPKRTNGKAKANTSLSYSLRLDKSSRNERVGERGRTAGPPT